MTSILIDFQLHSSSGIPPLVVFDIPKNGCYSFGGDNKLIIKKRRR
jgi:hypothetical protein